MQCSSPLSGHFIIPVLGLEWFDTFSYVQIMIPCILGTCHLLERERLVQTGGGGSLHFMQSKRGGLPKI